MNDWQSTCLGRRSLPRDLSDFEIEAFFTFSEAERQIIEERRHPVRNFGPDSIAESLLLGAGEQSERDAKNRRYTRCNITLQSNYCARSIGSLSADQQVLRGRK